VRGIWRTSNQEYHFVNGAREHIATLQFHGAYAACTSPFTLVRTLRRLLAWLDPRAADAAGDEGDEEPGDSWQAPSQ